MITCAPGNPDCGSGNVAITCDQSMPIPIQDIVRDLPEDIVTVDKTKIPLSMRKAFDNMISRIQREGQQK